MTELAGHARPAAAASPPRESAPKPLLEIGAGHGRASRESILELWSFREVLGAFAARQVKVKYKQAAIGIGWAVIQPIASAALFALFLGRLAGVPSDGAPYFLFALAGMAAWTYFAAAAGNGMESLVADHVMLRKVYFPREILPLAAVGSALVDFVPALATLLVAASLYGVYPSLAWLALPVVPLLLILPAVAVSLALSAINVYYRDVRYVLPFVLQLGLIASPVIYPLSVIPEGWRTLYAIANPVAAAIDSLRRIVLEGQAPAAGIVLPALAWSLALVLGGYALFKRLERGFSDRV